MRWVVLPIDDITRILADYAGMVGFPPDAQPIKWMVHPAKRQLMLVVEAASLAADQPPQEIKFSLKRSFTVS